MREPWFWRSKTIAARAISIGLSPAAFIYDTAQIARAKLAKAQELEKPVICIGNATLGGEGKTPFAILVAKILIAEGMNCQFLTRGYGGNIRGPVLVDETIHKAADVGDEALLLSRTAPVWKSQNRALGAEAAFKNKADVIVMDDGFQNPTIKKTMSILLYGGSDTIGNKRVFPAGPLREPMDRAISRANLIVVTNDDGKTDLDWQGRSHIAAVLKADNPPPAQRVVAFSGIGRPQKFFALLEALGFDVADRLSFPDHYQFSENDMTAVRKLAKDKAASIITTEKDYVRLSASMKEDILILPVVMEVDNQALLRESLLRACGRL